MVEYAWRLGKIQLMVVDWSQGQDQGQLGL